MNLLSLIFSKHFWKVKIPFSSVSENGRGLVRSAPPAASNQRRRLISLVEATFIYETRHVGRADSPILVVRLGLAPLPHYSSPLKRAIENLENLSERPSSRGDLKRSISFL